MQQALQHFTDEKHWSEYGMKECNTESDLKTTAT